MLTLFFNSLRKLRASDVEIEKAQRETTQILNMAKEGLFLLDPQFKVGSQFSSSISKVLQHEISANMPFMPILGKLVSDEIYASAHEYITLLFSKKSLILSLNPLMQVKVQTNNHLI